MFTFKIYFKVRGSLMSMSIKASSAYIARSKAYAEFSASRTSASIVKVVRV